MATDIADLKSRIPGQSWGTLRSNQIDTAKVLKGLITSGSRDEKEAKNRRLVKIQEAVRAQIHFPLLPADHWPSHTMETQKKLKAYFLERVSELYDTRSNCQTRGITGCKDAIVVNRRLNGSLHTHYGDPQSSPTQLKEHWQKANTRKYQKRNWKNNFCGI